MDRETVIRALIAGAIVLVILVGFKFVEPYLAKYLSPGKPAAKAPASAPAEKGPSPAAGKTPAEKPAPEQGASPGTPAAPAAPAVKAPALQVLPPAAPGKPVILGSAAYESAFDLEAEIVPQGAAVTRLALSRRRFFRTVQDRHLPPDERAAMDLVEPASPPAFTIPELRLRLKGADEPTKIDLSQAAWTVVESECGPTQAVLTATVADSDGQPVLEVRKTFKVGRRAEAGGELPAAPAAGSSAPKPGVPQYELRLKVEFLPADERVEKVAYVLEGPPALPAEGGRGAVPMAVAGLRGPGGIQVAQVPGKDLKKTDDLPAVPALGGAETPLAWAGQMDKYFAVVMIPQPPSAEGTFAAAAEAFWRRVPRADADGLLPGVRVVSKELAVGPGKPAATEFLVYAGPKDADLLETYYKDLALDKLIVWSSGCCFGVVIPGVDSLSRGLAMLLDAFYAVARNYGVAIILLVILLRVVLHPVTRWSTKSMAEMQKLQPKMDQIRKEFAHDKERMQQEMSKVGGLKAFGGCLPMALQMPIWIALYGALGAAIQLRHAAFIPSAWLPSGGPLLSMFLQDLSAPDTLVHWQTPFYLPGRDIPLLGWLVGSVQGMLAGGPGGITSLNVLPILMGVGMHLQQKLTPQPTAAAQSPQAGQQKQMMAFMSVFLTLMLYSAPAGLCLYIFTSTFLGYFEQKYLKQRMGETGAASGEAAGKAAMAAPAGPVERKSLVAGREKSPAERIQAWLQRLLTPPQQDDEAPRDKPRRK